MAIPCTIWASSGSLVDIDSTILIQLGIFLFMFLILRSLLFRPVIRLVEARHQATIGALEEAEKFEKETLVLGEEIDARVKAATNTASEERDKIVEKARTQEKELMVKTKDDAHQVLDNARQSTADGAEEVRKKLREETTALALQVASTVLRRSI